MQSQKKPRVIKVCILGSSGVGKSSILKRFITNSFDSSEQSTLGAAFMDKYYTYNNTTYKFQIWDTAGQEKYAPLAHMYYKDTHVALLVYDITSIESFHTLKDWYTELKEKGPTDVIIACVGNKIDLIANEKVDSGTVKDFSDQIGAFLKLTSAKDGKGIEDLFKRVCELIEENDKIKQAQEPKISLYDPVPEPKQPGGCFC